MPSMTSALVRRTLATIAVLSFGVAAYDFLVGGFYFSVFDVRVSSREVYKPFSYGMACIGTAAWLHDRRTGDVTSWNWLATHAPALASVAVALSVVLAIRYGTFVAGGSDSYGYVSQAARWKSGHLIVREPLAALCESLGASIAPVGYRLAQIQGSSVPVYAPGLPMVMALASIVGGTEAVYLVVPLFGAVAVWLTYLLGARVSGRRVGLVAAIALACSPIFVFQTLQPMSDVPVTTWWLAAWVLLLADGALAPAMAGLAASAAILTRPNLVPLAAVLAGVAACRRPRVARGAWFAAGVVPGCLAVAAINWHLYGSPLTSGYEPVDVALTWERASANLHRYPVWLLQLQSPAVLVALAAPFVGWQRGIESDRAFNARIVSVLMLTFSGVVLLCYLFYIAFGDSEWAYLRFMLPAIPLLLILAAHVVLSLVARVPVTVRGAGVVVVCTLVACWYLITADQLGVFTTAATERRYVSIGGYLSAALPPNAVVLTRMESGTVRWYGNRPTVRWDRLPAGALDGALDTLRQGGYAPYILLEDGERNLFRSLFAERSVVGRVDWPPTIEYRGPISVFVYAPDDRDRSVRGEKVALRIVPPSG
jgi:hypothetical protein